MNPRLVLAALVATAGVAVACWNPIEPPDGATICTTEARAAVTVHVVDSISGPTMMTGMSAQVRDGVYTDFSQTFFTNPTSGIHTVGLAFERKGTYTVTVKADGYKDWVKTGVVVGADLCHVIGVAVTAQMAK